MDELLLLMLAAAAKRSERDTPSAPVTAITVNSEKRKVRVKDKSETQYTFTIDLPGVATVTAHRAREKEDDGSGGTVTVTISRQGADVKTVEFLDAHARGMWDFLQLIETSLNHAKSIEKVETMLRDFNNLAAFTNLAWEGVKPMLQHEIDKKRDAEKSNDDEATHS